MMRKILVNKVQCKRCGEIILSESAHDLKWCKCGCVAVDGGTDYLRRLARDSTSQYIELSIFEK